MTDVTHSLLSTEDLQVAAYAISPSREGIDGSQGRFRAEAENLLGAGNDLEAIRAFLAEYDGSPATQRTYTKECERLLLWALLITKKPLSSLDRSDYRAYLDFVADPQPEAAWCGPPTRKRLEEGTLNPRWRPFVGPLAPASIAQCKIIIHNLLDFLVDADYLRANPLRLVRKRRGTMGEGRTESKHNRASQHAPEHYFDAVEWAAIWAALDRRPQRTHHQRLRYERLRFVLSAAYCLAARIGELASHTMGSFRKNADGSWRWNVIGKGGYEHWVPVNQDMLTALAHYRTVLGKSPLPLPDDNTPLFPNVTATRAITERRALDLFQVLFAEAAAQLANHDPQRAHHLRKGSPHWIRHTAITHIANTTQDLKLAQQIARHAKLETTALYLHVDDATRYQGIAALKLPVHLNNPLDPQ